MVRSTLSKIFSSKAFYIVFSLFVSIALWMYVEINENQTVEHTVPNVPILLLNKDVLGDRSLLITSMSPDYMTFTFECSRSVAAKLSRDTLSVSIDLANISRSGNTTLSYEVNYPPGVDVNDVKIVYRNVGRVSLSIDRQSENSVRVDVPYRGGAAEGFLCDPPEFSPQDIKVYGPSEAVSEVDRAVVNIQRESLTTTLTNDFPFILLDRNGDELSEALLDQLTFSDETIHVVIPVRMVKEVPLRVDPSYGAGATEQNTSITIDPPMVTIAGDPEDLRDFNSISLATIDLTQMPYSDTLFRTIQLPNNITNISGETEARVLVEVLGLEINYFTVPGQRIHVTGEPDGYIVEVRTQSVDVTLRGRQEDLASVTEANITILVILPPDIGPGTQRVQARVVVDGIEGDIGAIGRYMITVTIMRE